MAALILIGTAECRAHLLSPVSFEHWTSSVAYTAGGAPFIPREETQISIASGSSATIVVQIPFMTGQGKVLSTLNVLDSGEIKSMLGQMIKLSGQEPMFSGGSIARSMGGKVDDLARSDRWLSRTYVVDGVTTLSCSPGTKYQPVCPGTLEIRSAARVDDLIRRGLSEIKNDRVGIANFAARWDIPISFDGLRMDPRNFSWSKTGVAWGTYILGTRLPLPKSIPPDPNQIILRVKVFPDGGVLATVIAQHSAQWVDMR